MRRIFLTTIFVSLFFVALAQNVEQTTAPASTPATAEVVSIPKTDWLTSFSGVKIDGHMNVTLKEVPTVEECRITYDLKGYESSKFKFSIDRKGVLSVSEKFDPKRTTVTDVTIYYNSLRDVKIAHAKAEFKDKVENPLLDLNVSGGALVTIEVKTLDIAVECTGTSRLTLKGEAKYLTMRASTARVDCTQLSSVSSIIEASHSAEVRVSVEERLEATTSTGAQLLYKGTPVIFRNHNVLFGGDIINID